MSHLTVRYIRPIVTEKGVARRKREHTLCFEVRGGQQDEIKHAVQKLFKVKVADVRTVNAGKLRRRGRFAGYRAGLEEGVRSAEAPARRCPESRRRVSR